MAAYDIFASKDQPVLKYMMVGIAGVRGAV